MSSAVAGFGEKGFKLSASGTLILVELSNTVVHTLLETQICELSAPLLSLLFSLCQPFSKEY